MEHLRRRLYLAALILALGGCLYFLLSPQVTVELLGGSGEPVLRRTALYEVQGWWGITVSLLFSGLYGAPLLLSWEGQPGWAALFAVDALALTYLAHSLVGPAFGPAALALAAALAIEGYLRLREAPEGNSAGETHWSLFPYWH